MLFSKEELHAEIKRWQNRIIKSCTICNGEGIIQLSNSGKASMCKCQEESIRNAHLVASGIPRKYLDSSWNWDGLQNNKEAINKAKYYSENFIQNYFKGKGLYIYGQQGRGKSLLESLIARDVSSKINPDRNKTFRVGFVIFEELVQYSHQSRSDLKAKSIYNAIVSSTDLLIIDNIGSETGSKEYNTKLLEFVLRKRDNDCVPTIISSNYTPEQLLSAYSDTVHDFVKQNCEYVSVQGENFRKKGNETEFLLNSELDDLLLDGDL